MGHHFVVKTVIYKINIRIINSSNEEISFYDYRQPIILEFSFRLRNYYM